MSLPALLAALASQTRHDAVMAADEANPYSYDICLHKAELWRLTSEGFAQAAALETESEKTAARYHDSAARASASATFWSHHAEKLLEREAAAWEPA